MLRMLKYILSLLILIPISYLLIALLLTYITVDSDLEKENSTELIYLKSNGVHLDIVLPRSSLSHLDIKSQFVAVGWGDKDFYLKTPKFKDVTFSIVFKALFLKSESLIHITPYDKINDSWVKIKVAKKQLLKISNQVSNQFNLSDLKPIKGYGSNDFFYKSKGSYSCFNTCNTWINFLLKNAKLKACLWTPFSFRLMEINK